MKLSEYAAHDGIGLAQLIHKGEVNAQEVASAATAAFAAINPAINALIESWATEQAPATPEEKRSPLFGVPFLIKDLAISMKGRRCELASGLAQGSPPAAEDSFLMRRFRAAGLVTLGRTTLPEYAISTTTESRLYGPTRNPWNTGHSAGGSSGGSGAAVASGMVPVAHATDGGGSIRVPASVNGLFGLKSSRGRISLGPDTDEVWSGLAVHGAVSRSVRDSAALLDAAQGVEMGDSFYIPAPERPYLLEVERDPGKLRIGLLVDPLNGKRSVDVVAKAVQAAAKLCEDAGNHVDEIKLDIGLSWEAFVNMNACFWNANTAAWIDSVAAANNRKLGPEFIEPVTALVHAAGRKLTAADLLTALENRNTVARNMGRFFSGYDVLLSPTIPSLSPPIGEYNAIPRTLDGDGWIQRVFNYNPFTALANVIGSPAMSVPLAQDSTTHLPIGIQFIAGFGREDVLFRLAGQLEKACPWAGRKPGIWTGGS